MEITQLTKTIHELKGQLQEKEFEVDHAKQEIEIEASKNDQTLRRYKQLLEEESIKNEEFEIKYNSLFITTEEYKKKIAH